MIQGEMPLPESDRPNNLSNLLTQGDNQTAGGAQGNHNHSISGGVGASNSGSRTNETRPMHYVVNYIIKL